MIQDIFPHKFDNAFVNRREPEADDFVLHYEGNQILLIRRGDQAELPRFSDMGGEGLEYLFKIDDTAFFLSDRGAEGADFYYEAMNTLRDFPKSVMAFGGITGWHLQKWEASHRYCGRCAAPLVKSDRERALCCPVCGLTEYPKISPAVIVAVSDGDKLLMIKSPGPATNRFHLVAGFVEIGETFEEAAAREVLEETGVRVKNVRYYKSQPWAFSETIMIGFTAELDGSPAFCIQESEIAEARWVRREEIELSSSRASIGSELIENFQKGGAV